jgi:hypothetical protein
MLKTVAGLLTFTALGFFNASEAHAQGLFRRGAARQEMISSTTPPGKTTTPAARVYSYSYYTRTNLPVRTYVGYGANDFPFYGAPYGHPYDPWTWATLSGSYQAGLSRYYAPPLK